jgi:hypothetical protein
MESEFQFFSQLHPLDRMAIRAGLASCAYDATMQAMILRLRDAVWIPLLDCILQEYRALPCRWIAIAPIPD